MTQTVTPELQQWIIEQSSAGCMPEAVIAAMREAGWSEEVAIEALETTLREHLRRIGRGQVSSPLPVSPAGSAQAAQAVQAAADAAAQAAAASAAAASAATSGVASGFTIATELPDISRASSSSQIDLGDRVVDVLVSMRQPRVVVFGGLLSDHECQGLIEAARPRLARSLTVQTQTGGEEMNPDRTSNGMFFSRGESPLIQRIEERIARLVNWPVQNGEGLQVLHYGAGAEYKPHYDYFNPGEPGTPTILKRGGQRLATLVMYLNDPPEGGGTTFPDVGLEVAPKRGNAVFFNYNQPHPSTRSLHGGAPVLRGEKWVATKWLREREFI